MNLIAKLKKHGFLGSIKVLCWHCVDIVNNIIFYLCRVFPIDDSLIIFESEGDLTDNAYALYTHMKDEGFLKKYKIVWLVDDVCKAKENRYENTEYEIKAPRTVQVKRSFYLATCKWYIYDHCNVLATLKKRENQTIVFLSHGCGYKAAKGAEKRKILSPYDYLTVTGPLAAKSVSGFWNGSIEKAVITGYPRIDYFYVNDMDAREIANKKWEFNRYKKVIFWMPTFRQSINKQLSEEYIVNETGLPIFETKQALQAFSKFLKEYDILLVFKLHHLQAELPIFSEKMTNILVIRDEEIKECDLQLYQLLPMSDVLISDYSSVAIDYLPLNRPIVFTLDDYEEYDKSRGFFPQNAIDYMPGYHVYNAEELEQSLLEICSGVDKFAEKRNKVLKDYHTYDDGKASERILEFLNI